MLCRCSVMVFCARDETVEGASKQIRTRSTDLNMRTLCRSMCRFQGCTRAAGHRHVCVCNGVCVLSACVVNPSTTHKSSTVQQQLLLRWRSICLGGWQWARWYAIASKNALPGCKYKRVDDHHADEHDNGPCIIHLSCV